MPSSAELGWPLEQGIKGTQQVTVEIGPSRACLKQARRCAWGALLGLGACWWEVRGLWFPQEGVYGDSDASNLLVLQWGGKTPCISGQPTDQSVATEFPDLPANVSYNTEGALNEPPLDVSNIMSESGGNVKWRKLHPN
ncbi:hypothetical protein DSO57_1009555 [Entomophthora muscae]|uniref:Uncharacterized protein n=1 Tax=Entomophthora muscae TaxID=34485 RepID=A0ACC2S8W4_9FUNG|nr:hypothetical protein DSO57_1009555 [Entomophthora muscae]